MAKAIGKRELRKHLAQLGQQQLIDHLLHLGESFENVQAYLQDVVHPPDDATLRERYRQIIESEFFPARGLPKARLAVARKAVADYRKVAPSAEMIADMMLYYVEAGVRFSNEYGDMDERFYMSMERLYATALEWMTKHDLQKIFRDRCVRVVDETADMGWSFHDILCELYGSHFGEPDGDG